MKKISFYVLHPLCTNVDNALQFLGLSTLKDNFDFCWDSNKPDYCIVTELIYWNKQVRNAFVKKYIYSPILIFYSGEAVSPDFNIFDYGVGFDYKLSYNDRFCQLPPADIFFANFIKDKESKIKTIEQARRELYSKKGFCNFLYSNYRAHPNRDRLFYILSDYKRVDSLGKHLNNMGNKATGYQGHYDDCTIIKSNYKFSIASENAFFPGYFTEKILTSLEANTIPIYWGDPFISDFINPKRFIDCTHLNRLEDVVKIVEEIDNNDELWCKIVSEPWQTETQIHRSEQRLFVYTSFFCSIFSLELSEAKRAPLGTFPDVYKRLIVEGKVKSNNSIQSLFNSLLKRLK